MTFTKLSPDFGMLASYDTDTNIFCMKSMSTSEKEENCLWKKEISSVTNIYWSPNCSRIAILYNNFTSIVVYDTATGHEIINEHFPEFCDCSFSLNSKWIAVVEKTRVNVFDVFGTCSVMKMNSFRLNTTSNFTVKFYGMMMYIFDINSGNITEYYFDYENGKIDCTRNTSSTSSTSSTSNNTKFYNYYNFVLTENYIIYCKTNGLINILVRETRRDCGGRETNEVAILNRAKKILASPSQDEIALITTYDGKCDRLSMINLDPLEILHETKIDVAQNHKFYYIEKYAVKSVSVNKNKVETTEFLSFNAHLFL